MQILLGSVHILSVLVPGSVNEPLHSIKSDLIMEWFRSSSCVSMLTVMLYCLVVKETASRT